MLELNKIYLGDCLELMKPEYIPDKSINLIVIDPPYNIGKAEWDKIDNYIEWMGKVFKKCERVLKDDGSFYWFHNDMKQIYKLMDILENNTDFKFKQMVVWDKFNGTPNGYKGRNAKYKNQRNWAKCAEYCFFYTFQEDDVYIKTNKDVFTEVKEYITTERSKIKKSLTWINCNILGYTNGKDGMAGNILSVNKKGWSFPTKEQYQKLRTTGCFQMPYEQLNELYESGRSVFNSKRYVFNNIGLSSVWQYPPEKPNGHITPKPEKIIENIIRASSNEGDIILDCFAGSGTIGVAKTIGRNFIGIEKDEGYYKIACDRVENFKVS